MGTDRDARRTSDEPTTTFATDVDGETVKVHVVGELDASSGTSLRSILSDAFDEAPTTVVVDLDQTTFVDSVGLSVLVTAHHRAEAVGAAFEVHNVSPVCLRVLEITRLTDVLELR